jgi:hypothetical protein
MKTILLAQVGATLAMTGIIWFAQIVHYPLFDRVGTEKRLEYQADNMRLTGWVVGPLMGIEAASAFLLFWFAPAGISPALVRAGAALLVPIWLSTAFLQVPQHRILTRGYDPKAHSFLVRTNWIRTGAWSVRALLVLWMVNAALA